MAEALEALRDALMRGETVSMDETALILPNGTRLDRKTPAIQRSMRGRGESYALDAVFLQYKLRDLAYNDYVREAARANTAHVSLVDKKDVIAYLKGEESRYAARAAGDDTAAKPGAGDLFAAGDTRLAAADGTEPASEPRGDGDLNGLRGADGKVGADGQDGAAAKEKTMVVRSQRSVDSVLCVEGWDFSLLREKLGKHVELVRKGDPSAGGGGASGNARNRSGGAADGRGRGRPAAYDPRGDRYTATEDRVYRETMGSDFYEMGIDPSGTFKSSSANAKGPGGEGPKREPSAQQQRAGNKSGLRRESLNPSQTKRSRFSTAEQVPIIILPNTSVSLITFHNAGEFLENGSFTPMQELRARGQMSTAALSRMKIRRRPGGNCSSADYDLVCNPLKLTPSEWKRVVAVVCSGQAWQFKNWPAWESDKSKKPDNGLSDLFRQVCGFVFHYDDSQPPRDATSWNVKFLRLSRTRRHNDIRTQSQFWEYVDAHCRAHMRHLRY